jgi:hypothetical protein
MRPLSGAGTAVHAQTKGVLYRLCTPRRFRPRAADASSAVLGDRDARVATDQRGPHRPEGGTSTPPSIPRGTVATVGVALAIAAIFAQLMLPSASRAAEPCPNEHVRRESNVDPETGQPYSTELPDCRAYELVSPPETGGWEAPSSHLVAEQGRRSLVSENGVVLFESQAVPPETGALENGDYLRVFRSYRTPDGWVTRAMLPAGTAGNEYLWGVSEDGSRALINTTISFSPEDIDNPTNNTSAVGRDLYVSEEGAAPLFVTHGETPTTTEPTNGENVFANTDLSAVGFPSTVPLESSPTSTGCYLWTDDGPHLAVRTNTEEDDSTCHTRAVTTDGRAIISSHGEIWAAKGGSTLVAALRLAGAGASFVALSPDGETVYLATSERLVANSDAGEDLYAVRIAGSPPLTATVTCISCEAAGIPNNGSVTWLGQSGDGSHIFFQLANGDVYGTDSSGKYLIASGADSLSEFVFSINGLWVVARTAAALSPTDVNGGADVYEFGYAEAPKLITGGVDIANSYTPVAVSDSGGRVVYEERGPGSSPAVIAEWSGDETAQISPWGATLSYSVLSTTGGELENVFFVAHDPLVPADRNGGTADIYDARVDGGFAPCTSGNPLPPPGSASCTTPTNTSNPEPPSLTPYTTNLETPSSGLATLPPGTSDAAKVKPRLSCQARAKRIHDVKKRKGALKRCAKPKPKKGTKRSIRHTRNSKGASDHAQA